MSAGLMLSVSLTDDRARVEPLLDEERRCARDVVARLDRALHRCGSPPCGKHGKVEVHPPVSGRGDEGGRRICPYATTPAASAWSARTLSTNSGADALAGVATSSPSSSAYCLHGAGVEHRAPLALRVGLGQHEHDLVPRVDERGERRDGHLGSTGEDQTHGLHRRRRKGCRDAVVPCVTSVPPSEARRRIDLDIERTRRAQRTRDDHGAHRLRRCPASLLATQRPTRLADRATRRPRGPRSRGQPLRSLRRRRPASRLCGEAAGQGSRVAQGLRRPPPTRPTPRAPDARRRAGLPRPRPLRPRREERRGRRRSSHRRRACDSAPRPSLTETLAPTIARCP